MMRKLLLTCLLATSAATWADGRSGMAGPMNGMGGMPPSLPTRPITPPTLPTLPTPIVRPTLPPTRDPGTPTSPAAREAEVRDGAPRPTTTPTLPSPPINGNALTRPSRIEQVERLFRTYPALLERDTAGAPVLRSEVTLWLPESTQLPEGLLAQGFTPLRTTDVLGRRLVVLRAPPGLSLAAAIALTRRLVPDAEVDFNHLLLDSGRAEPASAVATSAERRSEPTGPAVHVGLVDEALLPAAELQDVRIETQRCPEASGQPARGHGSAVARVLARSLRQVGRQPVLHTADLGCGPGAVDALAGALQHMAQARVPVVNVSAVGPNNRVMAAVVAAFLARGHLLVAAVGNDGPAAPALYPAAYPGVVGVTGVDRQGRVLVEAGRGEHVSFAAAGIVDLESPDGALRAWRGTSFAAPVVAAALALRLPQPDPRAAAAAVADLARAAQDLGEPGRDPVYGHGLIEPDSARTARIASALNVR